MGRYLAATVLSIFLASCYVFAAPTLEVFPLEARVLKKYNATPKSKQQPNNLEGVTWSTLGLPNLRFDSYVVTAEGMTANLEVNEKHGFIIANNLCRKKESCPDGTITELIRKFISDLGKTPHYVAMNNIQEGQTIPLIADLLNADAYLLPSSDAYKQLTTKSPLGGIGKKLGTPQGLYVGGVRASKSIGGSPAGQAGGSTMVFFYTGATVPKGFISQGSKAGTAGGGVISSSYGQSFSGGGGRLENFERQQQRQQQRQRESATQQKKHKGNCDCPGCCIL